MERHELNRMFDQLAPTSEQEREGLRRLLQTERKVRPMKKLKKMTVLGIAAALVLVMCGFAGFAVINLSDMWLQRPSDDPLEVVRSALENQLKKDYTIAMEVKNVQIDEAETKRVSAMYMGSELAQYRGWTDECLRERFVVVKAAYYVEYDHKKTFLDDGEREQYFYLIQDEESGNWAIVDNTSGAG